jgi:hypothetical protein
MSKVVHIHPIINSSTGRIISYTHQHSSSGKKHSHTNNPAYHILKHKAANMLLKPKK